MQWPEEGEGAGVAEIEAAEVADAEPTMAASLKMKMENLISQVHQDGPHQDTPMGLQVQPVLAIGPKAGPRPTAVTLLSVDG